MSCCNAFSEAAVQNYQFIRVQTDDARVATLELNRPDRLNAFNRTMIAEWRNALARIADDPAAKAVLLTGAGRAFCAGGDVDEMAEMEGSPGVDRKNYLWRSIQQIPLAMERLEKPAIAAINGTARGAGLDMALMCDLRVAGASATFAESYIHMGVISGDGGTYFLPRVVGVARARAAVDGQGDRRAGGRTHRARQPRGGGRRRARDGARARPRDRRAAAGSDRAHQARGVPGTVYATRGAPRHDFIAHGGALRHAGIPRAAARVPRTEEETGFQTPLRRKSDEEQIVIFSRSHLKDPINPKRL